MKYDRNMLQYYNNKKHFGNWPVGPYQHVAAEKRYARTLVAGHFIQHAFQIT